MIPTRKVNHYEIFKKNNQFNFVFILGFWMAFLECLEQTGEVLETIVEYLRIETP